MLWYLKISHEHPDLQTWAACERRGYKTRHCKRQEGLERFKNKEVDVLVLNLLDEQQAFGITLTNAHHMVVCDPVLNEPLLHQVLSWIHRYGQKHEQHVKFLVVKGSFNELLHDKYVAASAQRFLAHGQTEVLDDGEEAAEGAQPTPASTNTAHDAPEGKKLELLREYFARRRAGGRPN